MCGGKEGRVTETNPPTKIYNFMKFPKCSNTLYPKRGVCSEVSETKLLESLYYHCGKGEGGAGGGLT